MGSYNRNSIYQYETSPRKLKPEYEERQKNATKRKKQKDLKEKYKTTRQRSVQEQEQRKKNNKEKSILKQKENKKVNSNLSEKNKKQKKQIRTYIKAVSYILVGFAILFTISYRNSLITANFNKTEDLKKELGVLQKENAQLQIGIQNSLNLKNVQKAASDMLGMQKLEESQKVYVALPKKDYVESASEQVNVEEDNRTWFERILDKIFAF